MNFTDTLLDRRMMSTDNNEYAMGLNDENEWDENIMDYEVPLDDRLDDYLSEERDNENALYNESGFDRERIY